MLSSRLVLAAVPVLPVRTDLLVLLRLVVGGLVLLAVQRNGCDRFVEASLAKVRQLFVELKHSLNRVEDGRVENFVFEFGLSASLQMRPRPLGIVDPGACHLLEHESLHRDLAAQCCQQVIPADVDIRGKLSDFGIGPHLWFKKDLCELTGIQRPVLREQVAHSFELGLRRQELLEVLLFELVEELIHLFQLLLAFLDQRRLDSKEPPHEEEAVDVLAVLKELADLVVDQILDLGHREVKHLIFQE